jgi:antitoxin YefM
MAALEAAIQTQHRFTTLDGRVRPGHDDLGGALGRSVPAPCCVAYVKAYNTPMRTTSYSELRKTLAAQLDRVTDDHEPVIITRERGKPAAVLMSLEDFASYEETQYLLKSPANAARLADAIAELEAGGGTERTLAE